MKKMNLDDILGMEIVQRLDSIETFQSQVPCCKSEACPMFLYLPQFHV